MTSTQQNAEEGMNERGAGGLSEPAATSSHSTPAITLNGNVSVTSATRSSVPPIAAESSNPEYEVLAKFYVPSGTSPQAA